ncbi:L-serine ammonia-lyase, iron-sulfur-dependent, subunit alpha [Feifania hominis]|uniref:L-serine dehydratase n=1 Tax=Feifania hominis TaxID=2763660 RepID=A0A926DCK9_9FIRM|nr:L-serine ammonia-lyase, iron-sulfur-dependent, subunit alpha [Feifania hominis]MBC8536108.1 L-serine ammonia-lyase, iron-sulfur-dependent, subunit alpha [Feifania hominis]
MKEISLCDMAARAEALGISLGELALRDEAQRSGTDAEQVLEQMTETWGVMRESVRAGLEKPRRSRGGMIGGEGILLKTYLGQSHSYCGESVLGAVSAALAVSCQNAAMGKIVAAPTAGASGILPGVLTMIAERDGKSEREIALALFTAAAVGLVISANASLSGAAGGCQAECGSGAAMAAAAAVELAGGTPRQACHAVAMTLKNQMGLVCDPVAGLVEVPCAKRNAAGAALALVSADMALAGIESVIPADEVIVAMGKVGRALPESLRETSKGGLAATPTGRQIADRLGGNLSKL